MFEQARAKLSSELGRVVTDDELPGELVAMLLSSDADGTVPGRKAVDGSLFRVVVQDASDQSARALTEAARPETDAVPVDHQHARALRAATVWRTKGS